MHSLKTQVHAPPHSKPTQTLQALIKVQQWQLEFSSRRGCIYPGIVQEFTGQSRDGWIWARRSLMTNLVAIKTHSWEEFISYNTHRLLFLRRMEDKVLLKGSQGIDFHFNSKEFVPIPVEICYLNRRDTQHPQQVLCHYFHRRRPKICTHPLNHSKLVLVAEYWLIPEQASDSNYPGVKEFSQLFLVCPLLIDRKIRGGHLGESSYGVWNVPRLYPEGPLVIGR